MDPEGKLKIEYPGTIRERTHDMISIDTGWSREPLDLGYVRFEPDDIWVETFYFHRYFNIFRIADRDGNLKGFYCNMSEPPVIEGDVLTWHDLAIDVWVRPDGSYLVLDMDEFEEKVLDPTIRTRSLNALEELRSIIEGKEGPFGPRAPPQSSSPDKSSIPSLKRNAAIRRPAAGSAHHQPKR
jgi:hypothetical protein